MLNSFDTKVKESGQTLDRSQIEILQVNLGKLCNLTCVHCHVEAGPTKTAENMGAEHMGKIFQLLESGSVKTLDLTGGAPEMNPHFRELVKKARSLGITVIDRCNLAILFEPGFEDLAEFLSENQVQVVASLPCYSKDNVDKQRGDGTFQVSIQGLQRLNELGYGRNDLLELDLVYNPVGPHLPPPQEKLEADYKERLKEDFGIEFNRLFTITNMPITRYKKYLQAFGQLEDYQQLLRENFNASTVSGLMCRNTLSVSWDGKLYDCDFNQMLGLELTAPEKLTLDNVNLADLQRLPIKTAEHCFACTAGSGSSCQGAVV